MALLRLHRENGHSEQNDESNAWVDNIVLVLERGLAWLRRGPEAGRIWTKGWKNDKKCKDQLDQLLMFGYMRN